MEPNYKITIPTPCHEDWNKMTNTTTGRFCGSCTKNVVDFTTMMPLEIQQYFIANKGQNICGRFKKDQLETVIIQVPSNVLYRQMPFHKAFLLAMFIAMGSSLFSCKNENGSVQNIDKVEVVDSIANKNVTVGLLLPPTKDTIDLTKEMIGKIDETKLDTTHHYYKLPPSPPVKQVKFTKPTKGKIKYTAKEPEVEVIMGDVPLLPQEEIILGKPAAEEIMGAPAAEEQPKTEK